MSWSYSDLPRLLPWKQLQYAFHQSFVKLLQIGKGCHIDSHLCFTVPTSHFALSSVAGIELQCWSLATARPLLVRGVSPALSMFVNSGFSQGQQLYSSWQRVSLSSVPDCYLFVVCCGKSCSCLLSPCVIPTLLLIKGSTGPLCSGLLTLLPRSTFLSQTLIYCLVSWTPNFFKESSGYVQKEVVWLHWQPFKSFLHSCYEPNYLVNGY